VATHGTPKHFAHVTVSLSKSMVSKVLGGWPTVMIGLNAILLILLLAVGTVPYASHLTAITP